MATTHGLESQVPGLDIRRTDLPTGPNVVVPPKDLIPPTDPEISAIEREMAKQRPQENEPSGENPVANASPIAKQPVATADEFAFAFDIDGVLMKGGQPIPEAVDALKYINGENPYGVKVYAYPSTLDPCLEIKVD